MKKSLKITLIAVAAAVLIAGTSLTAVSVYRDSPAYTLSLAERYLEELNYEQAVIEFEKYLEIEPKDTETWLLLADTYEKIGDKEKAKKTLERALKETDSQKANLRLEELRKQETTTAVPVTENTEPSAVETTAKKTTTTAATTTAASVTATETTVPETTTTAKTTTTAETTTTTEVATTTVTTTTKATTTTPAEPEKSSSDYPSIIDTSNSSLENIFSLEHEVSDMIYNRYYYVTSPEYESRFVVDKDDMVEFSRKEDWEYTYTTTTTTDYYRVIDGPFTSMDDVYAYLAGVYTDDIIEGFRNECGGYGAFIEKDGKLYVREELEYLSYSLQSGIQTVNIRSKTKKKIILDYVSINKVFNEYWYEPHSLVLINDGNGFKITNETADGVPDEVKIGDQTYSTDLERLELYDVTDEDIQNLVYMKNLKELTINSSNVTNIWVIESCPSIEKLTVYAKVQTLPYLSSLKYLSFSSLYEGEIRINGLMGSNLEHLEIWGNEGQTIDPNITRMDLLQNLSSLGIGYFEECDISSLSELKQLEFLSLPCMGISDLTPLMSLTSLKSLDLYGNRISDVSPLKKLTNLTRLYLMDNQISDISPLKGLTKLTSLGLSNNYIDDISVLQSLTNIKYLFLNGNYIYDLSPLKKLTDLTELSLSDSFIPDTEFLKGFKKLAFLSLIGGNISYSDVEHLYKALPDCEILYY